MDVAASNSLPAFGFLTAVEDDSHGLFGGYLVLSELGRPLEFHCSTPVSPSKAQKILYGSTLRSYVLGELIGQTLINKAQLPVLAVLTDLEEMLSLGLVWQGKLAWVAPKAALSSAAPRQPVGIEADSRPSGSDSPELELGKYRLVGSSTCNWSEAALGEVLAPLASSVELAEPFERIHEAIQEAQRVTEYSAGEADGNSVAA